MSESSASSNTCPRCGVALPSTPTAGLCPRCLMAEAMAPTQIDPGPAAQPPLPPEQIAPHFPQLEIIECLGRGGMGVVYKARQKSLNRFVALKILAPERVLDARFAGHFTREAQALAALNHPNIITIHDFGQVGGFYYLLMEFVDGVNLRQLLRGRKLTPEEALAIVPPLCDAMQFAHERGIVHRDIKPENLLLDKAGRVKVADFGIAKMLGTVSAAGNAAPSPAPENATQTNIGTPGYSAPEQKSDPQRVDSRADIYSLGVVFYEMLTGELPGKPIEPPSSKVQMDVRLDAVVLRALETKPELRYQQVSEVKTMVETIVTGSAGVPSDSRKGNSEEKRKSAAPPMARETGAHCKTHFSRTAIVGALFGFLGVAALVLEATIGESNLLDELPSLMLMAFGILLLVVSTILGWLAAVQIRRSDGKLRGMWLAVFDGLLFPLLALDVRFAWQANTIVQTVNTIGAVTSLSGASQVSSDRFAWQVGVTTVLIGIVSNILIVWIVGQLASQRQIQNERSGRWALGLFIAGTLGALLLLTTLLLEHEKFATVFGDLALILALVVAVKHRRERLGKFLVVATGILFAALAIATAAFEFRVVPARQARLQSDFGPTAEFTLPLNQQGWTPVCDLNHDQPVMIQRPVEYSPEEVAKLLQLGKPGLAIRYDHVMHRISCWGTSGTSVQLGLRSQWNYINDMDALKNVWEGIRPGYNSGFDDPDYLPQIIFFKTPQGRLGILQIISFSENPPSLKIRYKLLRYGTPAMPRGQNPANTNLLAGQNPSFGPVTERVLVANGPFVARLSQAEVELVAVGNEPWTNSVCWLPNGKLSSKPFPVGGVSLGGWTMDMVEKKVAVRIRNESPYEWSFPVCRFNEESGISGGSSTYQPTGLASHDVIFYDVFACSTNTRVMTMSVGIANGPWETAITLDNEKDASGHAASAGDWNASCNPIIGAGGDVAVSCLYSKNPAWESRMVYVDGNGKVVPISENSSRVETGQTGATLLVSSNEFSKIKEFRLQRRKYQWAEFDNVSLQSGFRTTVAVSEIYEPPIASIQPSAESANATPVFGTVIDQVVTSAFSFKSGSRREVTWADGMSLETTRGGSDNKLKFLQDHDIDLYAGKGRSLYELDMKIAHATWNPQVTFEQLASRLESSNRIALDDMLWPVSNPPTPVYWFETRNGLKGILQITGFTDNPHGVKIRYKLVQDVARDRPPGQNAASVAETVHIWNIPGDWSCLSGNAGQWSWTNNTFYGHSGNGDSILVSARQYDDVTLSAMVSTTNREASLAFRMQDHDNGYILIFGPDGTPTAAWNGGHVWLVKRQSGEEQQLAAINRRGLSAPGHFEKLTVIAKGPQLEVRLNDVSIIRTTDPTFKSGYIGMRVYGDSRCDCDGVFSNLTVRVKN